METKAQVTIFIILGIVLVASVGLFFVFKSGIISKTRGNIETNPNSFMESCIEDKVMKTVEKISLQGGYLENPLNKTFKFENEKDFTDISYLCYTSDYYIPCINQEPVLISHLKQEIKNEIKEDVKNCFEDFARSLEKQNYVVDARYNGFNVDLKPKKIILNINNEIILTKLNETIKQKNLNVTFQSRFYDLAIVTQEIISQEARFCNFEQQGFMLFYPMFEINKFRTGEGTIIYTVEHKKSKEKFKFGVRSCIIPPGI